MTIYTHTYSLLIHNKNQATRKVKKHSSFSYSVFSSDTLIEVQEQYNLIKTSTTLSKKGKDK